MFRSRVIHLAHLLLLIAVTAGLYLPGLGVPSLWDVDEGHNVQCSREMFESGNWITPTFNYQLRVDKPALLYWLQALAYQTFGVSEFAGRLPCALAAMLAVLLTYQLGRRLFEPSTALLGGLVLASSMLFTGSAHFANPDALLNACTVLTMYCFWRGVSSPGWWVAAGASMGVGFLAKGPVAVVLPLAVGGTFLIWTGQLRRLWTGNLALGCLVFAAIGLPWFALVGSETKGQFLRGFFIVHNRDRFLNPMEGHGGGAYYHLLSFLVGFVPWSTFLGPVVAQSTRGIRGRLPNQEVAVPLKFLTCWFGVYLLFFSVSGTKLPNYILPLYPAAALLTGWFLEGWRRGELQPASWGMPAALMVWMGVGVAVVAGLLIAGGAVPLPGVSIQTFPGLETGCFLGVLPIVGATVAWLALRRGSRNGLIGSLTVTAVLFVGAIVAWGTTTLDRFKAARPLVETASARQLDHEVRVGCFDYYQPSLVFYCEREVNRLSTEKEATEFLGCPIPVYLFLTASAWDTLQPKVGSTCRALARHYDLYSNCDVVVVTNR
jgi:4-amino-4-deoxy-L-arabinose transferase-like glycosyltransferase